MRVVATAGHVDHGKSSMVLALTGTDPDRFPEEKARGLTIDLGFAFTTLPSGEVVGFVDVPGHVRFVKNMLAGVGAVDVAILVVAATEGWMPQSEEHFAILSVLGIEQGVVALTKTALADDEVLELAQLELAERLAGTPAEHWPVVLVDSPTGQGIDELRRTLDTVLATAPAAADHGRPRLWIDRVFAAKGAGTVVTGTLTGGSLHVDDEVLVEPGGRRARVRGIEAHHERLDTIGPGSRVALNLSGIDHTNVHRGDVVVLPGQWPATTTADVEVLPIDGAAPPRRSRLAAHIGSGDHAASWRLLDADGRYARLRLDTALPIAPGDRIVVRSTGRRATVCGARVLDVEPARRSADALARLALPIEERVLAARPWLTAADLALCAGVDADSAAAMADALVAGGMAVRAGDGIVSAGELARVRAGAERAVTQFHRDQPRERGLDLARLTSQLRVSSAQLREALADDPTLLIDRDVVRRRDHAGAIEDDPEAQRYLAALRAEPFAPPAAAELGVDPAIVRALTKAGLVANLDGVVFATTSLDDAHRLVGTAVTERGSLTVSDIRDLLGSTRKYVLPIVAWLDSNGVTRRRGDDRIPGPRAIPA